MSLSNFFDRVLRVLTLPPSAPLRQLTLYYVVLVIAASVLGHYVPLIGETITGLPMAEGADGGGLRDLLNSSDVTAPGALVFDLRMAIVMLGTLFVTIPFSWGYMSIRSRVGYEQSVVQTLVILPIVVAGIMMIVQFSLALAFALGGVAAAVRFRNTLKDVADATYVFLAIGTGIAAGTGALSAALVMSAIFTYTSVILWRCNFGDCEVPVVRDGDKRSGAGAPTAAKRIRGDIELEVRDATEQGAVEKILAKFTKSWRLEESTATESGGARLQFAIRLKRSRTMEKLTDALRVHAIGLQSTEITQPRKDRAGRVAEMKSAS